DGGRALPPGVRNMCPLAPGRVTEFPPLPEQPAPWHGAHAAAKDLLHCFQWAFWHASGVLGEFPDSPVPRGQRDIQGGELEPSGEQVLLALAEIWIRTDDCDPGAKLIVEACPRLTIVRANQGKPPSRVGPIVASSATEAFLWAGQLVTNTLKSNFGC